MAEEKKIELNGKLLTESEFQEETKKAEAKPGVKIIKVKENVYKKQIQG